MNPTHKTAFFSINRLKFIIKWLFLSYCFGVIAIFFDSIISNSFNIQTILGQICIINITAIACIFCNLKWDANDGEVVLTPTISLVTIVLLMGVFGLMDALLKYNWGFTFVIFVMGWALFNYIWLLPKTNEYQHIIENETKRMLKQIEATGRLANEAKNEVSEGMTRDEL